MKKIIGITGLTGFVGQNLDRYLKTYNFNILPINRERLMSIEKMPILEADVIVHLAGKAHDLKKVSDPEEYYAVNFELTKQLYDAFLKSDARKFIFISSVKAAADTVKSVLLEDVVPDPQTHYGKSKLMAEQYIQGQVLPAGKSYYILRPCMIHGAGNKGNLNLLYKFVQKGIPYPLAAFKNRRSFLSVENLCFIIKELLIQDDVPSGIYHVADDEALSTNAVVTALASSLGKKAKLWHISKTFIFTFAKIGDFLQLPLTTERLNKLTESYEVGNHKITTALKIRLPVQAKEGIMITASAFK